MNKKIIKEDDGLSHKICLRCLGTLEFMCDFYDRCHQTQRDLNNKQNVEESTSKEEIDRDSNKENVSDKAFDEERTTISHKNLDPNCSDISKIAASDLSHQGGVKSDNCNVTSDSNSQQKKILSLDVARATSQMNIQTNISSKRALQSSAIENKENMPKFDRNCKEYENADRRKVPLSPKKFIKKNDQKEIVLNENNMEHSLHLRRSSRNSKSEHIKTEPCKTENESVRKVGRPRNSVNKVYDVENFRPEKRRCLRTICPNKNSESKENNIKLSTNYSDRHLVAPLSLKPASLTEQQMSKIVDKSLTNVIPCSDKSQSQSVTIKKERFPDVEDTGLSDIKASRINQLVWTPLSAIIQKPEQPRSQKNDTLSNASPPPGDEAEVSDQQSFVLNSVEEHVYATAANLQSNYVEASFTNETHTDSLAIVKSATNAEVTEENGEDRTLADADCATPISKYKEREKFGKISELITDEQKKTIESYYKVDMSVINEDKIQENLIVVDKKTIKCKICGVLYPRLDKCQVHIRAHLNMRPYKCTACDFSTVTVSNVRCHIRKSHLKIKPFQCYVCGKRYVTAVLLEEHLNTHTGARPFKCKVCNFASSSRQVLSYHNTTHKPTKDIICKVCGKQFYSRGRMRAHMLIHNKDKVVVCRLCSSYLSNAEALEAHNRNVHMRDYVCNVCGKSFKSRKALHNHQNVHSAAKYKCTLCPNVYKSSHILKEHLLKHEGIRKYKCTVCEKSFAQQSHLAAHMAVHSEIRFHCPGCQRAFNRHDNMKIHTKRCELFLANPALKELLIKRERTRSIVKSATDSISDSKVINIFHLEASNLRDLVDMKTDFDADKTDENINETEHFDSRTKNDDKLYNIVNHNDTNNLLEGDVDDPAPIAAQNINIVENVIKLDKF